MPRGYHSYLVRRRNAGEGPRAQQQLFDLHETARVLNVSAWTVRDLIWRGDLPSVRVGRLVRVDRRDVEAFIAKNRITSPA